MNEKTLRLRGEEALVTALLTWYIHKYGSHPVPLDDILGTGGLMIKTMSDSTVVATIVPYDDPER